MLDTFRAAIRSLFMPVTWPELTAMGVILALVIFLVSTVR